MSDADTTDEDMPSEDSSTFIGNPKSRHEVEIATEESRPHSGTKKRKVDHTSTSTYHADTKSHKQLVQCNAHTKFPRRAQQHGLNDSLVHELPFPHGALRHSFVVDSQSAMSISKDNLFLSVTVQRALVLCFYIEFDFLKTLFSPETSLDIVVDNVNFQGHYDLPSTWSVQAIAAKPFQCMHSKVFLLQCPGFLRLIVATSNLLQIDYDNLDNLFYIHDFPLVKVPVECAFKDQLSKMYADHMVESKQVHDIAKYNLSSCSIHLVVSIPGTYYGEVEDHRYGQLALANIVSEHGRIKDDETIITEHCSSSIGNLNVPWMQTFRNSLLGHGGSEASTVTPSSAKIIYASFRDVDQATRYGINQDSLAGNIVCNGKYSDASFPHTHFHHYKSRLQGTLYHAKTNLVYQGRGDEKEERVVWLVMGSHNFSQAAWGSVVVQGPRARHPGLKSVIANYEVSVVIPGNLLTDNHLLPPGVTWRDALTYRQETLERYSSDDRPWTVRINR